MNKILTFFFLFLCLGASAVDETQLYRLTEDIFGYLRIDQWIDYVKRIKTDEEIPNYYNYPPLDKETSYYFKKFDILGYEEGLKKEITKNVKAAEIQKAHEILKNPFVSKILNLLFFKQKEEGNFSKQVILAKDVKIAKERLPLIESIYNLLSYQVMADHMFKTIRMGEKKAKEVQSVLDKDNENLLVSKSGVYMTKMDEVKHVFYVKIDTALKKVAVNELRQFVSFIKDKSTQKLLGIYNVYDYFFIYKYNKLINQRKSQVIQKGGLKSK